MAGASPRVSRGLLIALVGAQLLGGVVGTTIGAPDVAHEATTGRLDVGLTAGPLLNMVQCRLDDRELGPWPDPTDGPEQAERAARRGEHHFDCDSETWRVTPRPRGPRGPWRGRRRGSASHLRRPVGSRGGKEVGGK